MCKDVTVIAQEHSGTQEIEGVKWFQSLEIDSLIFSHPIKLSVSY